jgi:hypothetical protein
VLHVPSEFPDVTEDDSTAVTLDDDRELEVPQSQADRFLLALARLRHSLPGIVIDTNYHAVSSRRQRSTIDLWFDYNAQPERQPTWLMTKGAPWMTPAERSWFEAEGGWARFDAAGWGADGPTTQF